MPTANVKNIDPGTYIKGNMGKVPKITVFGNFAPVNLKNENNDMLDIFSKKVIFAHYDVIKS